MVAATVIDCNANPSNKYRAFKFHSGEDQNSVVAGFTIVNGDAPTEQIVGSTRSAGGAIACDGAGPSIRHCVIANNYARINGYGGGICCWNGSNVKIESCTIINNYAHNSGSGIASVGSAPMILDCIIKENTTYSGAAGGGIAFRTNGTGNIENCIIEGNISGVYGGGIDIITNEVTINNCQIVGNSSRNGGGISSLASTVTVTNCSVVGNSANYSWLGGGSGGGFYSDTSDVVVKNCIVWNNTADVNGPQIYGDDFQVTFSDIQGGYTGTGNINSNPCFVTGPEGDYYLSQIAAGQGVDSPCVDAGSISAVALGMDISTTRTDHIGDAGIVDMGYHYPMSNPADINGDVYIDFEDFAILASQWQQAPDVPSADIAPQPSGDGAVDFQDLKMLVDDWLWPL